MGRPPSNGVPAFRFTQSEVAQMEAILQEHKNQMPAREVLDALAEMFSKSAERSGKVMVQGKQVWNWFQNKRYALRAKLVKTPGKLTVLPMPRDDMVQARSVPQAPQPAPVTSGRTTPENSQMEFEAKSARDGAWYDVQAFISHRYLETGDPEVLVRFAGFGAEEDEWVNVRRHVRQRSLPCESSECVAVVPGDLILCFQEGKEQALYFDAHVLDAQRRRHDVRGCRCRFLVRYDHDQSEEIVPLRKVCRRPETDYRLQQLHAMNESASVDPQKVVADPNAGNISREAASSNETVSRDQIAAANSNVSTNNVPAQVNTSAMPAQVTTNAAPALVNMNPNAVPLSLEPKKIEASAPGYPTAAGGNAIGSATAMSSESMK
ncbi:Protein SAWADEE HOMEODOMAIN HOMOLOG 2 [Ancistrocladus abbreviatus]